MPCIMFLMKKLKVLQITTKNTKLHFNIYVDSLNQNYIEDNDEQWKYITCHVTGEACIYFRCIFLSKNNV